MSLATETKPDDPTRQLTAVLSDRFVLRWQHTLLCGFLATFFVYLSYVPLFHSDVWGHVKYGEWILQHRSLPQDDPYLPLAQGMRVVDNAWLAQTLLAQAVSWGGPGGLSKLFAIVVAVTYLLYARIFYLVSGRPTIAVAGLLLMFFIGFSRHAIVRPEIFGGLAFALLLYVLVRLDPWRSRAQAFDEKDSAHWPRWLWVVIPVLFMLWANLHGSYAVGLVVLACHAGGRMLEAVWEQRSPMAVLTDRSCRRWVLLTELALLATLINPYGIDLLIATAQFGRNSNLKDVLEWYPLRITAVEGIQFAISIVLLVAVLRTSRQRLRATDSLLLLVFAFAVTPTIRMIGWYAPVFAFVLMPHIGEIWCRLLPARPRRRLVDGEASPQNLRFVHTMICLLLIWLAFSLSPISEPVLGGKPRPEAKLYSRYTPLGITEHLRENPPDGLVWAPQWWGDWLVWDGPPGIQVYMTTNIHLAPGRVWKDYLYVARARSGWERTLDRYDVQTLVVHKELQEGLAQAVRRSSQWKTVYEDEHGIILRRASDT